MPKLVQKEYEIIGFFAPITLEMPRHTQDSSMLFPERIAAFKYLMQNPFLSDEIKLEIAARFDDCICWIRIEISSKEKLEWELQWAERRLKVWEEQCKTLSP